MFCAQTQRDIYRGAASLLERMRRRERYRADAVSRHQFLHGRGYSDKGRSCLDGRFARNPAPFLDPRVGQFAASIPLDYKLHGSKGKVHSEKSGRRTCLPPTILHRPKKGFGIPIAEWLKGRLNPLMHDLLAPKRLKDQGLFDPALRSDTDRRARERQLPAITNNCGRCSSFSSGGITFCINVAQPQRLSDIGVTCLLHSVSFS